MVNYIQTGMEWSLARETTNKYRNKMVDGFSDPSYDGNLSGMVNDVFNNLVIKTELGESSRVPSDQ